MRTILLLSSSKTAFTLFVGGEERTRISLPVPGVHMVRNALAAVAVGIELGVDLNAQSKALESFPGVARRSEVLFSHDELWLIDDYGHHPTEIAATLGAVRSSWKDKRLIVLFEPHRYSRTRELFADFLQVFGDADQLIVGDIYPAGEEPIAGISGEELAKAIQHEQVSYVANLRDAVESLVPKLAPGDVVVTLGAGAIGQIAREFQTLLQSRFQ